jgi:TM2 domain-containing membrane protein YozV
VALIKCPECSTQVSDKAASCPSCGAPIATPSPTHLDMPTSQTSTQTPAPPTTTVSRSRLVYIILALLFAGVGFHNLYSGHTLRGAIKIGIFLIAFAVDISMFFYTGFSLVALVVLVPWSLIEIFTVKKDANGNAMT